MGIEFEQEMDNILSEEAIMFNLEKIDKSLHIPKGDVDRLGTMLVMGGLVRGLALNEIRLMKDVDRKGRQEFLDFFKYAFSMEKQRRKLFNR